MSLAVDPEMKALLTILKKLYRQRGSGRAISAFYRGVGPDVRAKMDAVLDLMLHEGFATRERNIYRPVQAQRVRANEILDNPNLTRDELVTRLRMA